VGKIVRHYLSLALRNVARMKLYAAISVTGLAIGFAAATLIGLYVHDELNYERWIPNSERIYQVSAGLSTGQLSGVAPSDVGLWFASDYPQFETVTRLFDDRGFFAEGDRKFNERITWADASVFDVFALPVVSGNLAGALAQPDSLVITRRTAQKYFGESGAVGKTLLYNGEQPMVVTAVIEDLPSRTHLDFITILAAAHAPYSPSALQDRTPIQVFGSKLWNSRTYFLLKPNEPLEPIRQSIATLIDRHAPIANGPRKASEVWALVVRPIRAIHLSSGGIAEPDSETRGSIYAVAAIGLLIMLVASINFVNLLTALGVRRALEVGVRKATGARRSDLFAQFMSESFLYVAAGAAAGLAIAAVALRPLNTFLRRTIDFSMFFDLRIAAAALLFLALVALLAGLYPAMVLSSFRPATVTKGGAGGRGQAGVRQVLVVLQFAILITLLIATTVTYRQMALGMREALRQNTDPIVLLQGSCNDALKSEMLRAPGVVDAACTMGLPQLGFGFMSPMQRGDRETLSTRGLQLLRALGLRARGGPILLRRARYRRFAAGQRVDDAGGAAHQRDGREGARFRNAAGSRRRNRRVRPHVPPTRHVHTAARRDHHRRARGFPDRPGARADSAGHVLRRSRKFPLALREARRPRDARGARSDRPRLDRVRQLRTAAAVLLGAVDSEHVPRLAAPDAAVLRVRRLGRANRGARPRRSSRARGRVAHQGDRHSQGARRRTVVDHYALAVAILEARVARERDRVARDVLRDERLAAGFCHQGGARLVDVRGRGGGDARGRRGRSAVAHLGDGGDEAGDGVAVRVAASAVHRQNRSQQWKAHCATTAISASCCLRSPYCRPESCYPPTMVFTSAHRPPTCRQTSSRASVDFLRTGPKMTPADSK
jgi:hypothetical protein